MTTKAIRRGGSAPKRTPAKRKSTRAPQRVSFVSRASGYVPVSEAAIRRAGNYLLLALLAAGATTAALMLRLPQALWWEIGEGVGALGFEVDRVEIRGIGRMDRMQIYDAALAQDSMAMLNVDLSDIRERVEQFGWVREARVSRRLPDTLVVSITERTPSAIWQHERQLYLIDADGVVLERVSLDAMPDLPQIVGPGANYQAGAFERLISSAPALRPMLDGATWVGGRRWDLRFQSGETLALPEGETEASAALIRFARMDGVTGLLGEGFKRFDMRIPGRFVVRVERGAERRDAGEGQQESI